MAWQSTPYTLPLVVAAMICIVVAGLVLRRRGPGAVAFAVLMAAVAVWAAGYALEIASGSLEAKKFWGKVQYFGIVSIPVAWFVFALRYSGRLTNPRRALLGALLLVPVTTLVLIWNPATEALVWRRVALASGPSYTALELTYGPWFWVHVAFAYALWAAATAWLLRTLARSPHLYRKQGTAIVVGVFAPWLLNVAHVTGLSPVPLDPTPFGFTVTGLAAFWILVRQQFLDIMPIARAAVIEGIRDGIIVLDSDDRIVDLNRGAETIIGKTASTVIGAHFDRAFSGRVALGDLVGEENELHLETVLRADGEDHTYDLRGWPLFDRRGKTRGRLIVFRDITAQKQAEDAFRTSEEQLRVMVSEVPAVLWTTNEHLCFSQMLGAGLRNLKLSPNAASGMDVFEFFGTADERHPAISAHLRALAGDPATYELEWFGRDFECHVEPLLGRDGEPCGTIGVGLDVTERENLQEQLRQSQKMEAIGRMAGGVAHDFNNLLTAVVGYAQLAQEDLETLSREPDAVHNLRRDMDAIEHAAERAASITGQLLAFSRKQVLQPRVVDLNEVVGEMEKMVCRLAGGHIELVTLLDPEIGRLKADPVQIQQVIINLVLNSRDAMPQGGTVTIETSNVELEDSVPLRYDVVAAGSYVVLRVTDDGFGMDEKTQAHLFEPFFTTKEEGKGTGLGLSTAYGIVRQSGGYIEVRSKVGEGSTFNIYFPRVEERVEGAKERATVATRRLRGSETILLVEDEDMVRVIATRVLSGHGYRVLEAAEGGEALDVCQRHEGPIDLVITDVVMPGMNGRELAHRLDDLLPGTRVLFISGYTGAALVEHGVLESGTDFLQKPFSPHRLTQKVREVLDQPELARGR